MSPSPQFPASGRPISGTCHVADGDFRPCTCSGLVLQMGICIGSSLYTHVPCPWWQNTKRFIHENVYENIVCELAAILSIGRWVYVNTHALIPNHLQLHFTCTISVASVSKHIFVQDLLHKCFIIKIIFFAIIRKQPGILEQKTLENERRI